MKKKSMLLGTVVVLLSVLLILPAMAQKKKKTQRARGNVGLVDTEKNYMILVTPKGKLVTVHFSDKSKITQLVPEKAGVKDIRLRANASIQYEQQGEKFVLKNMKFEGRPRKGKK